MERNADMDKNKTKKSDIPKSSKPVSDYKSREAAGKSSTTDDAFRKAFSKGKGGTKKG